MLVRHTAQLLAEEIEKVLKKIGPDRFAAIVTDNASNCTAARKIISEKYPFIFDNRYIAHCVNLITKDILGMIYYILNLCFIFINALFISIYI